MTNPSFSLLPYLIYRLFQFNCYKFLFVFTCERFKEGYMSQVQCVLIPTILKKMLKQKHNGL